MPVVRRSQRNRNKLEETEKIVESVTVKAKAKSVKHGKKVTFNPKVQVCTLCFFRAKHLIHYILPSYFSTLLREHQSVFDHLYSVNATNQAHPQMSNEFLVMLATNGTLQDV